LSATTAGGDRWVVERTDQAGEAVGTCGPADGHRVYRDLRELLAELLGKPPGEITAGQASYNLRRLRVHGLIVRIPGTHRCWIPEA
jgi:hypothetical protein